MIIAWGSATTVIFLTLEPGGEAGTLALAAGNTYAAAKVFFYGPLGGEQPYAESAAVSRLCAVERLEQSVQLVLVYAAAHIMHLHDQIIRFGPDRQADRLMSGWAAVIGIDGVPDEIGYDVLELHRVAVKPDAARFREMQADAPLDGQGGKHAADLIEFGLQMEPAAAALAPDLLARGFDITLQRADASADIGQMR